MLLGHAALINILMSDKVGNDIWAFHVTCQWKAEVPFEGKLDRELELQAALSKREEQLALLCVLRQQKVWPGARSLVAARSVPHRGQMGAGKWAVLVFSIPRLLNHRSWQRWGAGPEGRG